MIATEAPSTTPRAITLPEPGIYQDVPDAEYRQWPAMSKSTLEWGQESILHLKAAVDGKLAKKVTPPLPFGRALHSRLLEPARFKAEYRVIPDFKPDEPGKYKVYKGTNEYEGKVETFRGLHNGCTFLSATDGEVVEAMARSVYEHPGVAMLREAGGCEVSITWKHSTGLRLKSRLDKLTRFQGLPTILDIKGVRSCEFDALSKQIKELGWHRQGAMYVDGIHELTGEWADFILICIEKTYPYAVSVKQIGERSMSLGRTQTLSTLQRWKYALDQKTYAGFGDDIEEIDVPEWELRRHKLHEEL